MLYERQGTSWDQAWLLQQLLTAAGVDARLEWGEVEIPVEILQNLTLVEGVEVAAGSAIGSAEDVVVQATWTTPQGLETAAPFELWAGEHAVFTVDFGRLPQEVVDRYGQEAAASTDPSEQEAWNLAHAAALELRTLGGDLAHLSALR